MPSKGALQQSYMRHPTSVLTRMYWRLCIASDQLATARHGKNRGLRMAFWAVAVRRADRGWWRAWILETRRAMPKS